MKKNKKSYSILILVILLFLIMGSFSFAQGKNLEITYPEIPGAKAPTSTTTALPTYIKYIFNLSIAIAGLVAFGGLIYGGFHYLTSSGNPSAMANAKDQILAAFLGLTLILSSWLILHTINPQLTTIHIGQLEINCLSYCDKPLKQQPDKCRNYCEKLKNPFKQIGVYLFTKEYNGQKKEQCSNSPYNKRSCLWSIGDRSDLGKFSDEIKNVKIVNGGKNKWVFWTVLHEDKNYKGKCKIIIQKNGKYERYGNGKIDKASSAHVNSFKVGEGSSDKGYVKLCTETNFTGDCKEIKLPTENNIVLKNLSEYGLNDKVRSVEIEGNYIVVLFKDENESGECLVLKGKGVSDLKNTSMGSCLHWRKFWWGLLPMYDPCASSIAIYLTK